MAPRIYERAAVLLHQSARLISSCSCTGGCPVCVGPSEEQSARKRTALALLLPLSLVACSGNNEDPRITLCKRLTTDLAGVAGEPLPLDGRT